MQEPEAVRIISVFEKYGDINPKTSNFYHTLSSKKLGETFLHNKTACSNFNLKVGLVNEKPCYMSQSRLSMGTLVAMPGNNPRILEDTHDKVDGNPSYYYSQKVEDYVNTVDIMDIWDARNQYGQMELQLEDQKKQSEFQEMYEMGHQEEVRPSLCIFFENK